MTYYFVFHIFILCIVNELRAAINEKEYIIESKTLPDDVRFRPSLGNGHIATNVYSDTVYMNGVYNGLGDKSSRARLPAFVTFDVNITDDVILKETFTLDMYNGLFTKEVQTPSFTLSITSFAHRSVSQLFVTKLNITRHGSLENNVTVRLIGENYRKDSNDLVWNHTRQEYTSTHTTMYHKGIIKEPEIDGMKRQEIGIMSTAIPESVVLTPGQGSLSRIFLASYGYNSEDTHRAYQDGISLKDKLQDSHKQAWNNLWNEGRIDINGNKDLSTDIIAAFYSILCSLPTDDNPYMPFYGISPGGLSRGGLLYPEKPGGGRNDYAGHVFWDMDTWVMPPMLIFYPSMARRMVEARTRVLDVANNNAIAEGFEGAKFPWEQASTGIETTPRWAGNMSRYEIHVTADISYGLRQYLYATEDFTVLMDANGVEMAIEIARFWNSRVTEKDENTVEILGVMGPDEYHFNVNNSVFTNYNAKLSLLLPLYIVNKFNIEVNETMAQEFAEFEATANKMFILFDEKQQYHPQYDNFNLTASIKQSDVVLLGYPLMMPMSRQVRQNDLELYEKITDEYGPDTGTWSMHTVGWLELGDEDRAHRMFRMMFRNINEPFKVFSEKPVRNDSYGGCVNFITGAGGLLQSIVFGYAGIRLHPEKMEVKPTLLRNTTSWSLKGIKYKGSLFNIDIFENYFSISAEQVPSHQRLIITGTQFGQTTIHLNHPLDFKRQTAYITLMDVDDTINVAMTMRPSTFLFRLLFILIIYFTFYS